MHQLHPIHKNVICLAIFLIGGVAQADVLFNFDQTPPNTAAPFTETIDGTSASFGGQASVCNSFNLFHSLSGNVLIQGFCGPATETGPLSVAFSSNLSKITLDFATPGGTGSMILSAFENSTAVGSATFSSSLPAGLINGEGVGTFTGAFNSFVLTSDMPLAIDNLAAQTSVIATPEPSSLAFLLIGLAPLLMAFRTPPKKAWRRVRIPRVITNLCLLAPVAVCSSSAAAFPSPSRDFVITSPAFGATETGQVKVSLKYITENETPTIELKLNGRAINSHRFTKSCQGGNCTVTGLLTVWDGLRTGENQLSATLTGRLHALSSISSLATPVMLERTKFDYFYQLSPPQLSNPSAGQYNTIAYYTPASVGLSTLPNGGGAAGNPWLQLTTGYPADFNNVADAYAFPNPPGPPNPLTGQPTTITKVTIPYPDVSEGFTCGANTFQAYVLGRQNPYLGGPDDQNVETGWCGNDLSDLQTYFQTKFSRPLGSEDLVILGTVPGMTVPTGFDFSPFGGTNFSTTPASQYPQAYIMIGVPGAAAGTAYESFSIPTASNHPNTYTPSLNGTLMVDQQHNYNFVPSGNALFQVHSDSSDGSYIQVGSNTYTPPANGANFWLLVLDQETLTPVNYYLSPDSSASCATNVATQSCGATYSIVSDGGNRLAAEINSLSPHDLIFLVTQSCPVPNQAVMQTSLGNALHSVGGSPYSLNYLGSSPNPQNFCNYSLITVNDGKHWHPLTDPTALSAGGAFGFNNQYGSLDGFLARNLHGLYDVAGKDQMYPNNDGTVVVPHVDYTFQQVASSQRQDWPLVDSAFPIEAYADISFQVLTGLGETGSRVYDVRYFYTSSAFWAKQGLGTIIANNLGTNGKPAPNPFTKQTWDNATPAQFAAALQQIGTELQQGASAEGYFVQVGNQMAGADANIFSDMMNMATDITQDYSQTANATANTKLSNVASLLSGVAGLASQIPVLGPVFGMVNAGLTIGSAAFSLEEGNPPSPYAVFDDTLSNFNNAANNYTANLAYGFYGGIDNILSDFAKVTVIGGLTSYSDSTWNFPTQVDKTFFSSLNNPLVDAAARSIWMDVLPQRFGIRQFLGGPSANPGDYGFYNGSCISLYSNASPTSFGAYTTIGSGISLLDLYLFAEGPIGSENDVVVSGTLSSLLTTSGTSTIGGNQQDNLNIPSMLLYAYSNMNYMPFQSADNDTHKPAVYCYAK